MILRAILPDLGKKRSISGGKVRRNVLGALMLPYPLFREIALMLVSSCQLALFTLF